MRTVQKEVRKILISISDRLNIPYQLAEDVFYHEFEFVAKQMAKGQHGDYSSFENILVKKLGTFIANEKHINKLKEIQDDKNQQ